MEALEMKPEPQPPVIIEQGQRQSRSLLWRLQRDFFTRQGVEAWRQRAVPHYIIGGENGGRREMTRATAWPVSLAAGSGGTRKGDAP
jgi:hypothetical protein